MAFRSVVVSATSAGAQFFSSTTLGSWCFISPLSSNTSTIFVGDSVTMMAQLRTGDLGIPIVVGKQDAIELNNIYIRNASASNTGVLLYIERT